VPAGKWLRNAAAVRFVTFHYYDQYRLTDHPLAD